MHQPTTPAREAGQLVVPLAFQDIYQIMTSDLGIPAQTAVGLLAILGMGTQVHTPRVPLTPQERVNQQLERQRYDPRRQPRATPAPAFTPRGY